MKFRKIAAAALASVIGAASAVCVPASAEFTSPGDTLSLLNSFGTDKMRYSDEMFAGSAKKYSQDIAVFSAILSASEYIVEDGALMSENRLTELGFDSITDCGSHQRVWELTTDDVDYAGYLFAHKTIEADGKTYDLVSVTVKGTSSNLEWYSNFDVGTGSTHSGFYTACGRLEEDLEGYVAGLCLDPKNVKLHICGHSRGAAVANLLAEHIVNATDSFGDTNKLDRDWFGKLDANNVYAYLFAPPTTEKSDGLTVDVRNESSKYAGIYNFIDPRDPVPQMPLYGWGYSRCGKQIPLPSVLSAGTAANDIYTDEMDELFESFGLGSYSENVEECADSRTVHVFRELAEKIKSTDEYYNKQCGGEGDDTITAYKYFHDGIAAAIADYASDTSTLISTIAVGAATEELYGITNYFLKSALDGSLVFAHMPQNYIAGVMQLESTSDLLRGEYYRVNVEPALNVTVRDESGNAVGRVKDGTAVQYSQGVYSDGTDIDIYLPMGEKFTVSMTGSDSEKVNVTVYRENIGTGGIQAAYSIPDVPAGKGVKLGFTLNGDGSSMLGVMDGIGEGSPYSEIYRASFTEPVTVGEPEDEDNSVPGEIVIGDDDITVADDEADTDETDDDGITDDTDDSGDIDTPDVTDDAAPTITDGDPDGNPPTGSALPVGLTAISLLTAALFVKRRAEKSR